MGLINSIDDNNQNTIPYNPPASITGETPAPSPMTAAPATQDLSARDYSLLEQRTAENSNWMISLYHNGFGDWTKSDPSYNAWDKIKDTKYAAHPEYFTNTNNDQELHDAMTQVDEKLQYYDLASKAPSTAFWSSLAWGAADPLWVIPGLNYFKAVKLGAEVSRTASAIRAATLAGGIMGIEETAMQASQPERTAAESAVNMAAGSLIGGAFGAILAKPSVAISNKIASAQDTALADTKRILSVPQDEIPASIESAKPNIIAGDNRTQTIEDIVAEHNMDGHLSPFMKKWAIDHPNQTGNLEDFKNAHLGQTQVSGVDNSITEEELVKALEPSGTNTSLAQDTQNLSAGHVSWDARIMGLPQWSIKALANTLKATTFLPVHLEGLADSSPVVRDFTARMFNMYTPLEHEVFGKTEQLVAPMSLESRMNQDMLKSLDVNQTIQSNYLKYLQIDSEKTGANLQGIIEGRLPGKMKLGEFENAVIDALNTGDKHVVPEVQSTAQYIRNVLNERLKLMQTAGIETSTQPNYFMRVYNIPKIMGNRLDFEQTLAKDFVMKQKAEVLYTDTKGKELTDSAIYDARTKTVDWQPKPGETIKSISVKGPMSIEDARLAARDTTDKILNLGDKSLELGDVDRLNFERGSQAMRPRTLDTAYELLKPYLVNDLRTLVHRYVASTSRAAHFKSILNELGVDDLQGVRQRIRDVGNQQISKIENLKIATAAEIKKLPKSEQIGYTTKAKQSAMIAKLTKQIQSSERKFNDIASIALGQFKKRTSFDPFLRMTNQYNAVRLLGGVVVSSLGDPAAAIIKNGLPRVVWDGLIQNLQRLITGTNKLKTQDFRDALTAIQNETEDAIRFLMNPDQTPHGIGPIEHAVNKVGQLGQKLTLMQYWNNFWGKAAHTIAESRMLRNLSKGWKNLSEKEISYLKEGGIDENMANRIWTMQQKYGQEIRGTHISNSRMWSDRQAADHFNNFIRLETRRSPMFTEMGDIPKFYQRSELRRTMNLFKGFNEAAITKMLLSAASRHDPQAAMGVMSIVGMGMVVQILKDKLAGRQTDWSLDSLILNGLDKSGFLGILADPLFQLRRDQQSIDKYGGRAWIGDPLDYMLGPNASIVHPAYRAIMEKIGGQKIDKKTEYQLKSLIPFHNLFYLQQLFGKDKK